MIEFSPKQKEIIKTGLTSKVFTLMKTLGLTEEQAAEMIAERTEEVKSMNPDDVEMFGAGG
jgi:hypothetical protein